MRVKKYSVDIEWNSYLHFTIIAGWIGGLLNNSYIQLLIMYRNQIILNLDDENHELANTIAGHIVINIDGSDCSRK